MNVYIPPYEKDVFKHKFEYSGAKIWNNLPGFIKECTSLNSFKSQLKTYIKSDDFKSTIL